MKGSNEHVACLMSNIDLAHLEQTHLQFEKNSNERFW